MLMYMQLSNAHIGSSFTGSFTGPPTSRLSIVVNKLILVVMAGLGSVKVIQLLLGCSNKCSHYHSALAHKGLVSEAVR